MNFVGLQKYFSGMEGLRAHEFFDKTGIVDDLRSGTVFAAIRKEEVHFYYSGARLCVYKKGRLPTKGTVLSNNRYIGITEPGKSRDVAIPCEWFSPEKYQELKQNCRKWRPGESELEIVSQLSQNSLSLHPAYLPSGQDCLTSKFAFLEQLAQKKRKT
jgi:hypothetical protein